MVRPAVRGRAGHAPPPPPDYMTGMIQQMEVQCQFMQGLVDQLQRPPMYQQPAAMSLQDFVRLNPQTFHNSTKPLDADDWLHDITHILESAMVPPANHVNYAAYFLRGPPAQWWTSHKHALPAGAIIS